jgi:hypothetical protein
VSQRFEIHRRRGSAAHGKALMGELTVFHVNDGVALTKQWVLKLVERLGAATRGPNDATATRGLTKLRAIGAATGGHRTPGPLFRC